MRNHKSKVIFSRLLRRFQTRAESVLWYHLRNRKLHGQKFRRQYVVDDFFIVDFYCAKKRLVIEVDGMIHQKPKVRRRDIAREQALRKSGYRILRFSNKDVIQNIDRVLEEIGVELNR